MPPAKKPIKAIKAAIPPVYPVPTELVSLLMECGREFDYTTMLAAADWCFENQQYESLEWLLRFLATLDHKYKAGRRLLFTGSRRYGTPRDNSDFDWVFDYPQDLYGKLYNRRDRLNQKTLLHDYEGRHQLDYAFRFGPINLLLVSSWNQWCAWVDGTDNLVLASPVTHKQACDEFDKQIKKYNLRSPRTITRVARRIRTIDDATAEAGGAY